MSNRSVYSEKEDIENEERSAGLKDLDLGDMLGPLHSGREGKSKRVFI